MPLLAADLRRTAALSLEIITRIPPKDKETALKLGTALAMAGQVSKAGKNHRRPLARQSTDSEIARL